LSASPSASIPPHHSTARRKVIIGTSELRMPASWHVCSLKMRHGGPAPGDPLLLSHLEFDWESPVWRRWLAEVTRDFMLVRYDERADYAFVSERGTCMRLFLVASQMGDLPSATTRGPPVSLTNCS
jgi:hypothetical protein